MAGNNTIGTGALVLSANADKMVAGLDKAEKAVKKTGDKIKAESNKFSLKEGLLGGAIGGAVGKLGGDALKDLGVSLRDAAFGTAKMREETALLARASDEAARAMDRQLKSADEWLGTIADPKAKVGALEKQIAATNRLLAEQRDLMDGARARVRRLADDFNEETGGLRVRGRLDEERARADAELKAAESAFDKLSERLTDLNEQKTRLLDPSRNPALVGEINQLTESLKLQRDTFGMSANAAKLYELRMKGATAEQLAQIQNLQDELEALEEKAKPAAGGALDKLSGAFGKGSAEAYSIVAKFQTGNMTADNERKKQTRELEKVNAGLTLLRNLIAARGTVSAI